MASYGLLRLEAQITRVYNDPASLIGPQRVCFDLLLNQYERELNGTVEPLRLHLDGSAGTGKSYLIDMVSSYLFQAAQQCGRQDPVLRAAPTGVAAFNIHGRTLHSLLRLPVKSTLQTLSNSALIGLQGLFQHCRFLLIDEKSMLGLKQLYWIDCRLRQILVRQYNVPFGGLNVVLLGDFYQLPPVGEKALYDNRPSTTVDTIAAQNLYALFDKTIALTRIMRQQGDDEMSVAFRAVLESLREGEITQLGYALLSSRVRDALPPTERALFNSAIRLYATRRQVAAFNVSALEQVQRPVVRIRAKHNCTAAAKATDESADGLCAELLLSRGARIKLTSNILTSFGLVNGTMGIIYDICWAAGDDPMTTLPSMILVKPDRYPADGPIMFRDTDGAAVIPILPVTREWDDGPRKLSRRSFPMVLAYAITIHKSQGLTLDRIVMDISERDRVTGAAYVGISRSRKLDGIMFDYAFDISRFQDRSSLVKLQRREDRDRRALQVFNIVEFIAF